MKILIITPEFPPYFAGGISTFYRELVSALLVQDKEVSIHVITFSSNTDKVSKNNISGLTVEYLDLVLFEKHKATYEQYEIFPELRSHLAIADSIFEQANKGAGFDVIEVSDYPMLYKPWVLSNECPPVVVQMHGSLSQVHHFDHRTNYDLFESHLKLLEFFLLSNAKHILAYSQLNSKYWEKILYKKVATILPAYKIDHENISSPERFGNFGLVIGRIQQWKGPELLCKTYEANPDLPIIKWLGRDNYYLDYLSGMSAYLTTTYPDIWEKRIVPQGQKSKAEVDRFLKECLFVVVPSLWDTFNLASIEAMASGKVVIMSDAVGASELISHKDNGLIFDHTNPDSLAACIDFVVRLSNEKRLEMGRKAQQCVEEKLNPKAIAEARLTYYKSMMGHKTDKVIDYDYWSFLLQNKSTLSIKNKILESIPVKTFVSIIWQRVIKRISKI